MALNITINKASVAASFAAGATVATAVASGGTTPYVYSLATGGDKFAINSSTGVITTIAAMDITNIASFSVTATDSTTGTPLTGTSDVIYPPIQAATQNKFNKTNVIYKITKDIDLGHGILTIPAGCTLDFQGGSFSNGTIVGSDTGIISNISEIFKDILIDGTWHVANIYSGWFNQSNNILINNMLQMTTDLLYSEILIDKNVVITINTKLLFPVKSNTKIILNSTVTSTTSNLSDYVVFPIIDKSNICIEGSGKIIGDLLDNTSTTGEWGYGISIQNSNNICIKGIELTQFFGDGINISKASKDITISHIQSYNNRRLGMSITAGTNILVSNSSFNENGTTKGVAPKAGLGVEPNDSTDVVSNIVIEGCMFNNNASYPLYIANLKQGDSVGVNTCKGTGTVTVSQGYNTIFTGCIFDKVWVSGANSNIKYIACSFLNEKESIVVLPYEECEFIKCYFKYNDREYSTIGNNSISTTQSLKLKIPNFFGLLRITIVGTHYNTETIPIELIYKGDGASVKYVYAKIYDKNSVGVIKQSNNYLIGASSSILEDNLNCLYIKNQGISDPSLTVKLDIFNTAGDSFQVLEPIVNVINTSDISSSVNFNVIYDGVQTITGASMNDGQLFYDTSTGNIGVNLNNVIKWTDGYVFKPRRGATSNRPSLSSEDYGFTYFDTNLLKYICWNGTAWVNMDGTALT